MKMLKTLGLLLGFSLVSSLAQAGEGLKWYSDGSVDLITYQDREVIHLSKDQLGTMFGKGKQPFKGKKIAITVNNSGPKGGISAHFIACAQPGRN